LRVQSVKQQPLFHSESVKTLRWSFQIAHQKLRGKDIG